MEGDKLHVKQDPLSRQVAISRYQSLAFTIPFFSPRDRVQCLGGLTSTQRPHLVMNRLRTQTCIPLPYCLDLARTIFYNLVDTKCLHSDLEKHTLTDE